MDEFSRLFVRLRLPSTHLSKNTWESPFFRHISTAFSRDIRPQPLTGIFERLSAAKKPAVQSGRTFPGFSFYFFVVHRTGASAEWILCRHGSADEVHGLPGLALRSVLTVKGLQHPGHVVREGTHGLHAL